MSESFLIQSLASGVLIGGVYALVALGLNVIFGVMKIINFAHGALMMLAMYVTFVLFRNLAIDPYLSLFLTVPALFLLGVVIQRVLIRPVLNAPDHNQLLLTLGLSMFIEQGALVLWGAEPRALKLAYTDSVVYLGGVSLGVTRLVAFALAIIFSGFVFWLLQKTDTGKALRAASEERDGAALSGIPVGRIYMWAFGLGTACVGAAGALVTPFLYVAPSVGEVFNITAFIVVVLGGMGNAMGALVGGLIIGIVESLGAALLPGSLKQLVTFAVFAAILLFKPEGILVRSADA